MTNKALQNKIMRRVYLAYSKRLMTSPVTLQLVLFVLALRIFAEVVFVQRIIDTVLSKSLGNLPQYVVGAILNGDVLALIALGAMVFVSISLLRHASRTFMPRMQVA